MLILGRTAPLAIKRWTVWLPSKPLSPRVGSCHAPENARKACDAGIGAEGLRVGFVLTAVRTFTLPPMTTVVMLRVEKPLGSRFRDKRDLEGNVVRLPACLEPAHRHRDDLLRRGTAVAGAKIDGVEDFVVQGCFDLYVPRRADQRNLFKSGVSPQYLSVVRARVAAADPAGDVAGDREGIAEIDRPVVELRPRQEILDGHGRRSIVPERTARYSAQPGADKIDDLVLVRRRRRGFSERRHHVARGVGEFDRSQAVAGMPAQIALVQRPGIGPELVLFERQVPGPDRGLGRGS